MLVAEPTEVGIGAMLGQEGSSVICISHLLKATETEYSHAQKEALALFWAVCLLHKYLFGLWFTITTDHQVLQSLFNPNTSVGKATATMIQR